MTKKTEKVFNKILEEVKKDPNILGFFLGGSRSKGKITKHSDYDVYIIVKDEFLKKYKMVPVVVPNGGFIATNDPLLFQPLDDLRLLMDLDGVKVVLAPYSAILSTINFAYDMSSDSAEQVIQDMHEEDTDLIISEIAETGDLLEDTSDAPIIKLVNLMLSQAVKDRASDIHIEPSQNRIKIRYRVDGILYDRLSPPKHIQ